MKTFQKEDSEKKEFLEINALDYQENLDNDQESPKFITFEDKKFRRKGLYIKKNGDSKVYYICIVSECSTLIHFNLKKRIFEKPSAFHHTCKEKEIIDKSQISIPKTVCIEEIKDKILNVNKEITVHK